MCSPLHCMLEAISSSASAQRQCAHLEEGIRRPDGTLSPALHQQGHRGILSTGEGQETTSTAKDSYTPPQPCSVRTLGQQRVGGGEGGGRGCCAPDLGSAVGKREEALRRQVYQVVSQQVHEELHPPPPPPDWSSTTRKDFSRGEPSHGSACSV